MSTVLGTVPALGTPRRVRLRPGALAASLGPAFVAAVAYVDPGNVATNVTAGSRYGYLLCWVVVAVSGIAMVVQYLSAKLGIATGQALAAHCRSRYPRRVAAGLWAQAECVAVATELAEVLGGALALSLLFGTPLLAGALITLAGSVAVLTLQKRSRQRRFEAVLTVLLAVCGGGFVLTALRAGPSAGGIARGMLPGFAGTDSLLLAAGILGATVMPHAIYLHSALVCDRFGLDGPPRNPAEVTRRRRLLTSSRLDILTALSLAAVVNLALVVVAAAGFTGSASATIDSAYAAIGATIGPGLATLFALALLASGIASSSVGAYAGAVVLQGFATRTIPPLRRRLITMLPALAVIGSGMEVTKALVLSQVVLSFGVPFALWPLIGMTRDRTLMGSFVNARATTYAAAAAAAGITLLNVGLVALMVLT